MPNTPALPPRHILSKSTFIRGCQCTKSLWLYKKHYKLRDQPTALQERIFMQGTDVGMLARQLFGKGVDASPADVFHYREAVAATARYIAEGHSVIFEAAFQHEGVLCAVDILLKHHDKWYVYEVKSSTSVKPQFVQDAALQYNVITQAGLPLEDIFVVYINTGYVRSGGLQLKELFAKLSVRQQAVAMQPLIATKGHELKLVATQNYMPAIATGTHCTTPYQCDFYGFCHHEIIAIQKIELAANTALPPSQPVIEYTSALPLSFLDVCSYRVAVPEFDGHWPYRHIPFQFGLLSLHEDGETETFFVADNSSDPCMQMVESLSAIAKLKDIIWVSNLSFITARFTELQADYPTHAEALEQIKSRLKGINSPQIQRINKLVQEENKTIDDAEEAAAVWYNMRLQNSPVPEPIHHALKQYADRRIAHLRVVITGS